MYTLKAIPKSDYSIRNFYAYKNWTFTSGSDASLMTAEDTTIWYGSNTYTTNNITYNKHSLFGQLRAKYYSGKDVPIVKGIRKLDTKAKVFSIPNQYLGECIRPGSLSIYDTATTTTFTDNTSGSLLSGSLVVGDIFYQDGVIVYTHTASVDNRFTGNWSVTFKSVERISEHQIFLQTGKNEFNISTNRTAVYLKNPKYTELYNPSNGTTQTILVNEGTKYIRKKSTLTDGTVVDYRYPSKIAANVSGGFEHQYLSSSVDSTGSFLTPFATTIGLYDDSGSLLVVAKLPRPIKMEPGYNVNFIVRFDT